MPPPLPLPPLRPPSPPSRDRAIATRALYAWSLTRSPVRRLSPLTSPLQHIVSHKDHIKEVSETQLKTYHDACSNLETDIATLTETLATRMEDLRLVRERDKDHSAALARTLLGHKQQQHRHEQGASECEAEIEAKQTLLGEARTERDRCKAEQAEQEKVRGPWRYVFRGVPCACRDRLYSVCAEYVCQCQC